MAKKYKLTDAKISFISLVNKGANGRDFAIVKDDGAFSLGSFNIFKVDEVKKQVTSVVYAPDVVDAHGDSMDAKEIEKMAHDFAKNGLGVDVSHDFKKADAHVVESWIAKEDGMLGTQVVTKGSWLATVEIADNELWDMVVKGEINAFSMGGKGRREEVIEKSIQDAINWNNQRIIEIPIQIATIEDLKSKTTIQAQIDEYDKEIAEKKIELEQYKNELNNIKKGEDNMNEEIKKLEGKLEGIMKSIEAGNKSEDILKEFNSIKDIIKTFGNSDEMKEEIEAIKKGVVALDETIKKMSLNTNGKIEKRDLNSEIRMSIVKKSELTGKSDNFTNSVKTEITKSATTPADVSAIIEVPISDDMVKYWSEASPLFADARRVQFKGESTTIAIKNKKANSVEAVKLGEGTSGKGGVKWTYKKLSKGVVQSEFPVLDELVADTKFNLVSEIDETIREDFAEYMADKVLYGVLADSTEYEGNRFEGVQSNLKFMSDRTTTQVVAGKLDWKELTLMKRKLTVSARSGAKYYVSKEAADLMETMTDDQNRPLWKESTIVGQPNMFAGYPVVEVYNMGLADNDLMVLFANFNNFYVIGTDYELKMENDRNASARTTNIVTNSRLGGVVRDIESGYGMKKKAV